MPDSFPATVLSGPCGLFLPLQIERCNGDCAAPFHEAAVCVKGTLSPTDDAEISCVRMCIADAQIFMGMTFDLLFRPNKTAELRRIKALQILENFFNDTGGYCFLQNQSFALAGDSFCQRYFGTTFCHG